MSTSVEVVDTEESTTKAPPRPNRLKTLTLSDVGGIIAAIGIVVMSRAGWLENRHQAEMHEHRDPDREIMLYATAPSRQALRAIVTNQSTDPQPVEALIQANIELNTCLQEYKAHVDDLAANCGSYDQCLRRFATADEDDNVVFNENSGLTGATPGLNIDSRPLRNIDISRGPVQYVLTESSINLTILLAKVAQALRRHQTDLAACRARIVLVDRSLADLQREQRGR